MVVIDGVRRQLTVEAVVTREQRRRVFDLREVVYRERSPYLLQARSGLHPAQDEFDGRARLFVARLDGEPVATCRWVARHEGRWEAGRADELPAGLLRAPDELLQVSRVVVRSDLRRRRVTEVLLRDACRWLLEHTGFRAYFALCLPALARFYVHFGATTLEGEDVHLAEREGNVYRFVHGTLAGSADEIEAYLSGTSALAAPVPIPPNATATETRHHA